MQLEKAAPRKHYLHILQQDLDRLEPGEYLNDALVDFWMMWITRKEPEEENNTQFYTVLVDYGVEHVLNWSDRRDTDVFSKRIILIPVNKDKHWSLCALFNAALVNNSVDDITQEVPFILFLDPLNYHSRVEVVRNVRNWLNAEWNRKHNTSLNVFNNLTMESFSPRGMCLCIMQ